MMTNHPAGRCKLPKIASVLGGLFAASGIAMAEVDREGLDEAREFTDEGVDYLITYSDTAGDDDRVSTADVDNLEDFAKTSYDRLVDVMAFREPWLSTLPTYEFVVAEDWWYAEPSYVVLDSSSIRDWPADDSRVVFFHERFHTVQRNYKDSVNGGGSGYIGSTFGKWVSEGTADAMMDKGYPDLDDKVGYPFYEGSAVNFLNSPDQSIFDKEYDCCLWWNYCMEQVGTNQVEPHYGTEFMRAFWDRIVANGNTGSANSKLTLEQELSARGTNLPTVFHDFTICNYTREFDLAGIPNAARYRYVDEQTQAITTNVPRTVTTVPGNGTTAVSSWSAKYIEGYVEQTGECFAAGFKAVSDGDQMAFAAVAVDRLNRVIAIKKGIGTEFAGVFFSEPGRPIDRICGIVAALEEDSSVDWNFDAGVPTVDIQRPTFAHPAYPGPFDEPGNLVVTTRVTGLPGLSPVGPNTPSILGLDRSYFDVTVGTQPATVIDAAYVGGLWELLVAAPVQAADGLYNVTVDLCPGGKGGVSDTSNNSVLYGDLTFHHAVVLDVSGSMVYPTTAKLDAAKQAAKFYIDTVDDDDRFTVVSFSGNGTECNEDAVNLKGSAGLLAGTTTNRDTMKATVEGLPPQDLTSIGDGLWAAQAALDNDATPGSIDTILLLTDGKENESRYWDQNPNGCGQVNITLLAKETIVNTRAFGENAETDLCQQIAAQTGGDYLFNPVDEDSGAAAMFAVPSDFNSLTNQLTLRFFAGLEHTKKLQRIALIRELLPASDSKNVPLEQPYDQLSKPLLYVGWSEPTDVDVSVETPDGQDLAGISKVYQDSTHIVFHPNAPLIKGNYVVRATEKDGNAVEMFCGISGQPGNALHFTCTLSPVKNGGLVHRAEHAREIFEHGMPVDISLAGFDLKGPLLGLDVTLEVTMPDGQKACMIPLQMEDDGAHQDGADNDGRYGFRYPRTPRAASYVFGQGDRGEKAEAKVGSSGTYRVVVHAKGKDNSGSPIDRSFEKAFQVYRRVELGKGGDTDEDGLSDSWEFHYGTDPIKPDADEDPDMDGLRNADEFEYGTHPHDPDTDNGGASDGYEVAHALCQLNPVDDPFPNLAPVGVITTSDAHGDISNLKPDALLLHFPDHPNYHKMEIYRDKVPDFPCDAAHLVHTLPMAGLVTSFHDGGLADKQVYYYKFRALSVDGSAATPFSREVSGVARTDPAEPFGSIVLNSGQEKTDRLQLAVKLLPEGNAKEYRLADRPFTAADPWLALPGFGSVVPFTLTSPPLVDGTLATVYFQFRAAGGLESRTYHSAITLDFTGNNDGDALNDQLDPDDDNDGVSDTDELFNHGTNPYGKDTDGDGYSDQEELGMGSEPTEFDSTPDVDGDGYNDKLETILGANPNDPGNTPNLQVGVRNVGNQTEVSFNTAAGVIYRVHSRSNLDSRVRDWPVVEGPLPGNGVRRTVVAPLAPDRNFYGVSYELAPLP